jgi:pimeloyl-ACP methyl ester carboxylesterase
MAMRLDVANFLAGASNASYLADPFASSDVSSLTRLNVFKKGTCRGFVGSNDDLVVVSFRGTSNRFNSFRRVIASAREWLRNLNVFQTSCRGARVHAGFDDDLNRVWNDVGSLIVDHRGDDKPVFLTGHSAGGALATLAAHRYKLAGLNVHSAYVFASPRVGDRAFAADYAVPLYRIENGDDLVPHVPLPPLAMKAIDFVVEKLAELIRPAFPNLVPSLADQFEYVHAGKLFFVDWEGRLTYSHTLLDYAGDVVENVLSGMLGLQREELPGTPIPKTMMDAARALRTAASIGPQVVQGTFEFFTNHPMRHHLKCLRRLLPC